MQCTIRLQEWLHGSLNDDASGAIQPMQVGTAM
jgi:hypothetical protein